MNEPELPDMSRGKLRAVCGGRRVSPPTILELEDFINRVLPPRELLLSPWLPRQGLVMVHAPRGVGKTHFALAVAYAVASGGEFLGWSADKPAGVLLLDGEMPAPVLQDRLSAIAVGADRGLEAPFRLMTPDMQPKNRPAFNIGNLDDQEALEQDLDGVDLIIVDNIATLCRGGRENEAESWAPIQEWALSQRAAGRSVLFVHHSGKGGQQRGTSSREDVLDTVINLRRPSNYEEKQGARFEIHFEKARGFFGDDSVPIEAQLSTDLDGGQVWTVVAVEDALLDRVIEFRRKGLSHSEIAGEVGRHKSRVTRMLQRAKRDGLIDEN